MKRFCGILLFLFLLALGNSGCESGSKSSLSNATTFTVTFDSNGGSEVPSVKVTLGDTVEKPADPVKEGYSFGNWFRDNGTFQNAFNFGSDKVSSDITLYARWLDSNDLVAEYVVGEIVIGYADGDNPKYVTQNLTLPTKVDSSDISWSSSSGAISSNGTVTRQATDTDVTLTATASYNGKSANRTFELKVIKKRTRDNSKIQSLPIETASSGDISITRNESGDVVDIEGNYATFDIENADDAIDALTVIKDELGIKNPIEELVSAVITSDKYGAEYQFQQVHNGVKVYGRGLMASANVKNNGDFLHSNLLPSDVIAKADGKNDIGKKAAENAAKSAYTGDVEISTAQTEKIIYSLEKYTNNPIYAYIIRVSRISANKCIDENVFINAESREVIRKYTNLNDVNFSTVMTYDELGKRVNLPIIVDKNDGKEYYIMKDAGDPIIEIYSGDLEHLVTRQVDEQWNDYHQNSAYANIREVMRWWKYTFGRNSLNNKGMIVKVVTHERVNNWSDNAFWKGKRGGESIFVCDRDKTVYTTASAIDVMTHETTHAVLEYDTIGGLPYENVSGAINEAYADIFGCIKDHNWYIAEDIFGKNSDLCWRNIANPVDVTLDAKSVYQNYRNTTPNEDNDHNGVHTYSLLISHTAYLMHEDHISKGLNWEELGELWYKSIHMGLSSISNFEDVRRCVVWAAMEMDLSEEKLAIIKAAFDEVGIHAAVKGTFWGTVTEFSKLNTPISDVEIQISEKELNNGQIKSHVIEKKNTSVKGFYLFMIEAGKYHVSFDKDGYITESYDVSILASGDISLDVQLKKANSVSGVVLSKDETPLSGVTVRIFEGQSATGSELNSTTTDASGKYSISLKKNKSGYYTLKFSKNGYKTETLTVYVSGEVKDQKTYLEKNNGTGIAGTVYDSNDGTAISDVSVQLFEGGEGKTESVPVKTATTNSNGEYSFNLNENGPGDYTITLTKEGYKGTTETVSVSAGNVTEHDAYLEKEYDGIPIDEEHFPDENFRSYVKENFDSNNNDMLNRTEIANATEIFVSDKGITSLQGIEYFTALQILSCYDNQLTTLDVSKNATLHTLYCFRTKLTTLNISGCINLQELNCSSNQLTILDVRENIALVRLNCADNKLTELDLSNNRYLKYLQCNSNKLTVLDISNCSILQELYCSSNGLITLYISNCSALQKLQCDNNKLTALDVGNCSILQILYCYDNQLITLNVNGCTNLQSIRCYNNQLSVLDVSSCYALKTLSCSNNQLTHLNINGCNNLQSLYCTKNQLTILDVRNCNKNIDVDCDDKVTIIWPNSRSTVSLSSSSKNAITDSTLILATIPIFNVSQTNEYSFDILFDRIAPKGSILIFSSASDDLQGVFFDDNGDEITMPLTTSLDHVQVSASFEAGKTYSPVIAAHFEAESSGGGCNAGLFGIVVFFSCATLLKKRDIS